MNYTDDLIGSNLIYAITKGLYAGKIDCIREYIQNSWDAKAKEVSVKYENEGINIVIEDDGEGMDEEGLRKALGVGLYTKDINRDEGQYGVGIWSGVAVSDKIVIISKKKNMDKKIRVEINAKKIREEADKNIPINLFLTNHTSEIESLDIDDEEKGKSFTIIRLEGITDIEVFKKDNIKEFIAKKLPVPISPKFNYSNIIKNEFDNEVFRTVNVSVENEKIYRLQNVTHNIFEPIVRTIKIEDKDIAKIWYSVSSDGNAIKGMRGFVLKRNGFTIMDWESLRALIGGRFNERYIGEIHIMSQELRPTTDRADIQSNELSKILFDVIKKFLISLQRINSYQTTNIYSPLNKIKKIESSDVPLERKREVIKEIRNKNFKENVSGLANDLLVSPLISQLKQLEEKSKRTFEEIEKKVSEEEKNSSPDRPELKKYVASLTANEGLKKTLSTLMEKKHEDNLTINPFNDLKEKMEKKLNKNFSSFSYACDEIGKTLTLAEGAKDRKEHDDDVKQFFKYANKIFRNYFEHAQNAPQTKWFYDAKNKDKLKAAILSLIALIDQMIDQMEVISSTESMEPKE